MKRRKQPSGVRECVCGEFWFADECPPCQRQMSYQEVIDGVLDAHRLELVAMLLEVIKR